MNYSLSSNNTNLKIARFLIGFYIAYNVFLAPIGYYVPRLSMILLVLAIFFTVEAKRVHLSFEFKCLLLFTFYSLLSGYLVAINKGMVTQQVSFLVESVIAGIIIFNVSTDENELKQIVGFFSAGAIIVGVYLLFNGVALITDSGRLSLNEDFNSNTLGIMLMYGIWGVMFFFGSNKMTIIKIALIVFLSLVMFYSIIQTGSRKSSLSAIFLIVSFAIFIFLGKDKSRGASKIIIITAFIALVVYAYFWYIDSFLMRSEMLMNKMDFIHDDGDFRQQIIKDSIRVWIENPIFGVGLNNNRFHTIYKMYAHNSFAEILACTGIIGAILFFPIFWRFIVFFLSSLKKIKELYTTPSVYFMCILILAYFFVCYTQINLYNQTHMFITYFILSFISIRTYKTKNAKKNTFAV